MEPAGRHFHPTYELARAAFRAEVSRSGGELITCTNPHGPGVEGEDLTTDIAWFGPRAAPRVFISVCGTHGQEFFAGSAGQLAWLRSGGVQVLPPDVAVCLVHAHNPFGASHFSRTNENNVDLNRNWFDHSAPRRTNDQYGQLDEILFGDDLDEDVLGKAVAGFFDWVSKRTPQELADALDHGQQSHPKGIIYCGVEAEWATSNLRRFAQSHFDRAEKVALIDWHTGLGAFGKDLVMADLDPRTDEYRWACAWWGCRMDADKAQSLGPIPEDVGYIKTGLAADLRRRGVAVASAVMEWGTYDTAAIMEALIIDRWLRVKCNDPHGPHAVVWRARMMERLNPTLPEWREAVIRRSNEIYADTICGLGMWS